MDLWLTEAVTLAVTLTHPKSGTSPWVQHYKQQNCHLPICKHQALVHFPIHTCPLQCALQYSNIPSHGENSLSWSLKLLFRPWEDAHLGGSALLRAGQQPRPRVLHSPLSRARLWQSSTAVAAMVARQQLLHFRHLPCWYTRSGRRFA